MQKVWWLKVAEGLGEPLNTRHHRFVIGERVPHQRSFTTSINQDQSGDGGVTRFKRC